MFNFFCHPVDYFFFYYFTLWWMILFLFVSVIIFYYILFYQTFIICLVVGCFVPSMCDYLLPTLHDTVYSTTTLLGLLDR